MRTRLIAACLALLGLIAVSGCTASTACRTPPTPALTAAAIPTRKTPERRTAVTSKRQDSADRMAAFMHAPQPPVLRGGHRDRADDGEEIRTGGVSGAQFAPVMPPMATQGRLHQLGPPAKYRRIGVRLRFLGRRSGGRRAERDVVGPVLAGSHREITAAIVARDAKREVWAGSRRASGAGMSSVTTARTSHPVSRARSGDHRAGDATPRDWVTAQHVDRAT